MYVMYVYVDVWLLLCAHGATQFIWRLKSLKRGKFTFWWRLLNCAPLNLRENEQIVAYITHALIFFYIVSYYQWLNNKTTHSLRFLWLYIRKVI